MSIADLVQAQLDAYNVQDLDAYCACFAGDAIIAELNGAVTQNGLAAIRERYAALFAQHPRNHARLLNRIAVGDLVVDHEEVTREPGEGSFQMAALYTVRDGRIARLDFVRAGEGAGAAVVGPQVDAYNARDAVHMCGFYAPDCVFAELNGPVAYAGASTVREKFAEMFAANPQNRCWIPNRIDLGACVIDHEEGERAPGVHPFKVASIYTLAGDKIARVDFAREKL